MSNRFVFTKSVIEALSVPGTYYDEKQPGLVINVTANSKRFGVYKWNPTTKAPARVAIGAWPSFNVDLARAEARKIVAAMDRGEAVEVAKPSVKTLRDITNAHEQTQRATKARAPTGASDAMRRGASDWLDRPAASITKDEVQDRHNEISATRGPVAAATFVKFFRAVYNTALLPSPAAKVKTARGRDRTRVATPEEMTLMLDEIEKQPEEWRDLFHLIILTGARRGNVQSMCFEHVAKGIWTIPGNEAKEDDPIELPLVPEAVEIIERRRAVLKSGYVFPSDTTKEGHLMYPYLRWDACRKAAGAPDLTPHDMRRTLGSRLAKAEVNPKIAQRALGHKDITTTLRVYTVVSDAQVLDALTRVQP